MTCHLMGMTGDDLAYSRPMIIRKCSQAKGGPRQLLCQAMQRQSWHLTSAPQCRDDDKFILCSPGCLDYTTFMYSTSKAGELVFTCRCLMEVDRNCVQSFKSAHCVQHMHWGSAWDANAIDAVHHTAPASASSMAAAQESSLDRSVGCLQQLPCVQTRFATASNEKAVHHTERSADGRAQVSNTSQDYREYQGRTLRIGSMRADLLAIAAEVPHLFCYLHRWVSSAGFKPSTIM